MAKKINTDELKKKTKALETEMQLAQVERTFRLKEYQEACFKIYDNCDHFKIISDEDYDSWEGRHNYSYGCIKCGLNSRVLGSCGYDYDSEGSTMLEYFKKGRGLSGAYCSNLRFDIGKLSYYGGFVLAKNMCEEILSDNPDITNEELEKELEKRLKSLKGKERSRK